MTPANEESTALHGRMEGSLLLSARRKEISHYQLILKMQSINYVLLIIVPKTVQKQLKERIIYLGSWLQRISAHYNRESMGKQIYARQTRT